MLMSFLVGDLSVTMKINKMSENLSIESFYYMNGTPTIISLVHIFNITKCIVIVNSNVLLQSDLTLWK